MVLLGWSPAVLEVGASGAAVVVTTEGTVVVGASEVVDRGAVVEVDPGSLLVVVVDADVCREAVPSVSPEFDRLATVQPTDPAMSTRATPMPVIAAIRRPRRGRGAATESAATGATSDPQRVQNLPSAATGCPFGQVELALVPPPSSTSQTVAKSDCAGIKNPCRASGRCSSNPVAVGCCPEPGPGMAGHQHLVFELPRA